MGISFTSLRELGKISFITLLGIRFWDPVYDQQVGNSLEVTVRPEEGTGSICRGIRNSSGLYTFQSISGLRSLELAKPDTVGDPIEQRRYLIQVTDRQQRFLPIVFGIMLPLPENGVFPTSVDLPISGEDPFPGVPLFSASTRPVPTGQAIVRAQLFDRVAQMPAAHAFVKITINGEKWYGIADSRGTVAVHFVYPKMKTTLVGDPPGPLPMPLTDQQWNLKVEVFFRPGGLEILPGTGLPDLREVLQQASAKIVPSLDDAPVDEKIFPLAYGQELVLKTEGESELYIEAE